MAKMDAEERQSRGEPVPEEIQRLLSDLVTAPTATGEIVEINHRGWPFATEPGRDRRELRPADAGGEEPAPGD